MELNDSHYAALKTELTTDPLGLGYVGKTDEECADLLNIVAPDNTNPEKRMLRDSVESWEIIGATTYGQYIGLSADQKQLYGAIIACGHVDPSDVTIRTHFAQLFPSGASRTQLEALQWRWASRAEKLFGSGAVVRYWDVHRARTL